MILSILLVAAAPVSAQPANTEQQVCKVVKDNRLKSRRVTACGTEAQWQAYYAAIAKQDRQVVARTQAYAGVGSGY